MVCPTSLTFQSGMQSVGLTRPDGATPVNGNLAEPYFQAVMDHPDTCTYNAAVGSTLNIQNGSDITQNSVNYINNITSNGAYPVTVAIPVLDMGSCGVSGPSYNQNATIVGFMRVKIVGARWNGAAPNKVDAACPGIGKKNICVTGDCSIIPGSSPGGTINPEGSRVYLVK